VKRYHLKIWEHLSDPVVLTQCNIKGHICTFANCLAFLRFLAQKKNAAADPSQQCKIASNSIQDPPPRWILTIFKLKFGGGNLFSPAMTSTIEGNNSVGSLLKPLLKKVTPVVGSRMLCCSRKTLNHRQFLLLDSSL
jgi:hypothetical protein